MGNKPRCLRHCGAVVPRVLHETRVRGRRGSRVQQGRAVAQLWKACATRTTADVCTAKEASKPGRQECAWWW